MPEQPSIVVKVRNVSMSIEGDIPMDLRDDIRKTLSYVVPNFKYMPCYKKSVNSGKPWDGTSTVALIKGEHRLEAPSGLLSYIKEVLDRRQVPYSVEDERLATISSPGYSHTVVARDYQKPIIESILSRKRGVLKVATGGGKTQIIIAAFAEAAVFPAMFYVTSCDLLEQAYDRFMDYTFCNGKKAEIGRIGGGHCDIKPITIATVQSCERALTGEYNKYDFDDFSAEDDTEFSEQQKSQIKDVVAEAQFAYVDECHHVSCKTIQSILNNSYRARFRVGGSASPWRDDGLDILIEACFGRRLCDIDASFLIERGFLIKPTIVFNHFNQKLGPAETFNAHYKKYVVENSARNNWIAERAVKYCEEDKPTIILVKWVSHAEELAKLIPGAEILAASGKSGKSSDKRKKILDRMRKRELKCVIGTSLLDEGIDVPAATVGIFAGGGKSSTRELQRIGRFIRKDDDFPDKDSARIEDFFDHTRWLMHHAKARRRILDTERAFDIMDNRDTMSL
jgi:superfamily II DNA or RNA helicase